jgi:hypothetical protein
VRGIPRTLTTRVSRLEARAALAAEPCGLRLVYSSDPTGRAEMLPSDPAGEEDPRPRLVLLYGSGRSESLI